MNTQHELLSEIANRAQIAMAEIEMIVKVISQSMDSVQVLRLLEQVNEKSFDADCYETTQPEGKIVYLDDVIKIIKDELMKGHLKI